MSASFTTVSPVPEKVLGVQEMLSKYLEMKRSK